MSCDGFVCASGEITEIEDDCGGVVFPACGGVELDVGVRDEFELDVFVEVVCDEFFMSGFESGCLDVEADDMSGGGYKLSEKDCVVAVADSGVDGVIACV